MKLGCRYLLAALVSCAMAGCTFVRVGRPRVQRPPADVTVYNVYSTPQEAVREAFGGPPAQAPAHGWRRKVLYHYYPRCEVYYSPARNCYIWRGPHGWTVTANPPEKVVLDPTEAVTVDLESNGPTVNRAEISVGHAAPPAGPPSGPPGRPTAPAAPTVSDTAAGTSGQAPAQVDSSGNGAKEDVETDKAPDDRGNGNDKDKDKDKSKGNGKGKGKGKGKDKESG